MKIRELLILLSISLLLGTACAKQENVGKSEHEPITPTLESIENAKTEQEIKIEEYINNMNGDWNYYFQYDVTGDGFPELVEILFEETYIITIYDFSGGEPEYMGSFNAQAGEDIYFCEDVEGNRFFVSHFGWYGTMGSLTYNCEKTLFKEHAVIRETLGRAVSYHDTFFEWEDNLYYNSMMQFAGEDKETLGYFMHDPKERLETEVILIQHMEDYLKKVDILDIITMPQNEHTEIECFKQEMQGRKGEFEYVPDYDYKEWISQYEKNVETNNIMICGMPYDEQAELVILNWKDLDENFDSDILNKFPNLKTVCFEGESGTVVNEKIMIKSSEWCNQIEAIKIYPEQFELVGDMGIYSNLEDITISGNGITLGNTKYLSELPQVKNIHLYIEDGTVELIEQISKMESVELITHTNYAFYFSSMSDEEKKQVKELLSDKVFVYVK